MNVEFFSQYWALLFAAVPALVVAIAVTRAIVARSAPGQLRSMLANHRSALKSLDGARVKRAKAERYVEKLVGRADQIKPRILEEAQATLRDAQALEKIAAGKVLVTTNHVRRVIHEEFPPSRHDEMRARYLPVDG